MSIDAKMNIAILLTIFSFIGGILSLNIQTEPYWKVLLAISAIIFVSMIIVIIILNKQANKSIEACTIPIEATLKWFETGSGKSIMLFLVLEMEHKGRVIRKGYSQRGGVGVVELTQFFIQHPVGSKIKILTNGKNFSAVKIAEINLFVTDTGEKLILKRAANKKTFI
ncbi:MULTISPECIES: hypothetical protein [Listeria]|uniref:hypothetical protein n=1 Tax=Listeria TaxID=1637 RepID=UPI000B58B9D0|nr:MULTISPECIES: hypothetical protein [Listeria]